MSMVVKNNNDAIRTLNTLNKNSKALSKSLQKVSSGMKINSASDGASEYAISERMRVQIRSLDQANANAQNGNALLKTAEGAVSSTIEILKSLKEKAINSANDTNTEIDRTTIQKEIDQFIDQIDENANVTYNGKYLLDGTKNFQGDASKSTYINMSLATDTTTSTALTALRDRAGHNLGIQSTDSIHITFMTGDIGATYFTQEGIVANNSVGLFHSDQAYPLADDPTISSTVGTDRAGNTVYTPDNQNALVVNATNAGLDGQIAGLSVIIIDNEGNVRKSATEILNSFVEYIHAEDVSEDNALTFHTGAKSNNTLKFGLKDMRAEALGLRGFDNININVKDKLFVEGTISVIDTALSRALDHQTSIGAVQARLEYTSANLTTASENVTASESTIRDSDMAKEMTEYTKNNVLLQAAQSMLAQANQNSSAVLSLLQ